MSYFIPAEGMIIQGVRTNISKKNPTMLKIKEKLKVLNFDQNPGLKRNKIEDYDQAFYHVEERRTKKHVALNTLVNGRDVEGNWVRGKPIHAMRSKGYLVIAT